MLIKILNHRLAGYIEESFEATDLAIFNASLTVNNPYNKQLSLYRVINDIPPFLR